MFNKNMFNKRMIYFMAGEADKQAPEQMSGPDAAKAKMEEFMPKAEELSTRERSKKYPDMTKEELDDRSKDYPKPEKDRAFSPNQYDECKANLLKKFDADEGGKWVPGFVAKSESKEYKQVNGKDMMEVKSVVMISGNKVDQGHFFGKTEMRAPTAEEQKKIDAEKAKGKAEADKANAEEIDGQVKKILDEKLKNSPGSLVAESDDLAKKVSSKLKGEGDWAFVDGANNQRVVAFWLEGKGKQFFKGDKKA